MKYNKCKNKNLCKNRNLLFGVHAEIRKLILLISYLYGLLSYDFEEYGIQNTHNSGGVRQETHCQALQFAAPVVRNES